MIVDLRSQENEVYFNGIFPLTDENGFSYSAYRLNLVSRYSNNEINNDTFGNLLVKKVNEGDGWFSVAYSTDISGLQNLELNTYYDCNLQGNIERGWVDLQKVLCKILNNFNVSHPDTTYISNNEDNEQFIHFINE